MGGFYFERAKKQRQYPKTAEQAESPRNLKGLRD
jgi:hypothetical protein